VVMPLIASRRQSSFSAGPNPGAGVFAGWGAVKWDL